MEFSINNGPFGGRDGKNVTSRVIRDRLMREMRTNISIQVEDTDKAGVFSVSARGAMQIAVLVETMRRENYELCVSRPTVIMKRDENDRLTEPYETMYVEVPDEHANGVMKLLHAARDRWKTWYAGKARAILLFRLIFPPAVLSVLNLSWSI